MKSKMLLLAIALLLAGCANTRQVGQTKEAAKGQRDAANRVGSQFNGVR